MSTTAFLADVAPNFGPVRFVAQMDDLICETLDAMMPNEEEIVRELKKWDVMSTLLRRKRRVRFAT